MNLKGEESFSHAQMTKVRTILSLGLIIQRKNWYSEVKFHFNITKNSATVKKVNHGKVEHPSYSVPLCSTLKR